VDRIGAGTHHSLVVKIDEDVYGTGDNRYGQLGLGDTTNRNEWTFDD